MRHIIDRLRPLSHQTLFHGSPHPGEISIGPDGALFGSFDQAMTHGRHVHECSVDLGEGHHDTPSYEGGMVRIWDGRRVHATNCYDTHCDAPLDESAFEPHMLLEYQPEYGSHLLLVTGHLARAGLKRIMTALNPTEFTYEIRVLDKAVAAWFDIDFIADNIGDLEGVDVVLIPGMTMPGERLVDETALAEHLGIKVVRGTKCYSELPTFFEMAGIEVTSDDIVRPRIIMLGRPGSGKTTYGEMLSSTYAIPHVSVGDLIRAGVEEGDEAATEAARSIAKGELVLHNVMAELVRGRILMPDMQNGFILDGYPRILRDVQWLSDMGVKPDAVVFLECDPKTAEERLIARHGSNAALTGKRIGQFEEETMPVIDHYRELPGFIEIDTTGDDVRSELYTKLETMFQKCLQPDGRN